MHELSLCRAIADTVVRHAEGRPVERVEVRIGHLRQAVPDAMQLSWEALTAGTELDGCELAVEHVPAVVACRACGAQTTLDLPVLRCGTCEATTVELVTGEELLVAALDVREGV